MQIFQQLSGILEKSAIQRLFTGLIIFTDKIFGGLVNSGPQLTLKNHILCQAFMTKILRLQTLKLALELWMPEGLEKELNAIIDKGFAPQ